MTKYSHAKWQVIGNFSPGQFSFFTKKEAIAWAKRNEKEVIELECLILK